MNAALILFALQAALGAFDTLYYHEWRARLPMRGRSVAAELQLHAVRDFAYAFLFFVLPLYELHGALAMLMSAVMIFEIVITFVDFATEARVRKPFGDVFPGERITHGAMAILYGAACANFVPHLLHWYELPTALIRRSDVALPLVAFFIPAAIGVFFSGLRDLYASTGRSGSGWPWKEESP